MVHEELVLRVPSEPDVTILKRLRNSIQRSNWGGESGSSGDVDSLIAAACCQVEIHLRSSQENCLLYSLDCNGRRKTRGGDEFYIRYEECSVEAAGEEQQSPLIALTLQAVAITTDVGDGSYELDFCTTPMCPKMPEDDDAFDGKAREASWTVHFEYTNTIGAMAPPRKSSWKNGGYIHTTYQIKGDPMELRPPHIRKFHPPSRTSTTCNLSRFDQVFLFGDSTFCQFARQRPNKKGKYYFQPNLRVLGEKVRVGLNLNTVSELVDLLEESNLDDVLCCYSDGDNKKRAALIVGSCLWDILDWENTIQGSSYDDHAQACVEYVGALRRRYPNLVIVWKSPMACHSKSVWTA